MTNLSSRARAPNPLRVGLHPVPSFDELVEEVLTDQNGRARRFCFWMASLAPSGMASQVLSPPASLAPSSQSQVQASPLA